MSRIHGDKINLGSSFILSAEGKSDLNKEIVDAKMIADSIIADAKKQAAATMAQAENQAAQIVQSAKAKAETSMDEVTAEAKKQGYAEGYEDGKEKITTELENKVYNVDNFAKSKFEIKNRIIKSLHLDILDLVLDISEKVCKVQMQNNREVLSKVVANAISQLKEKEQVTIVVHPEMAQKIYDISDELKEAVHNLQSIKIIEDNSISPDGTIVESVGSRVDARVSAQIEQIAQKLMTELNSTPEIELSRELDDVDGMNDNADD
ncbi:MAG: hypothetical protein KHX03_03070 [Clostridium sp.]|nr:hypothetical protein [Clostridium sp.]